MNVKIELKRTTFSMLFIVREELRVEAGKPQVG